MLEFLIPYVLMYEREGFMRKRAKPSPIQRLIISLKTVTDVTATIGLSAETGRAPSPHAEVQTRQGHLGLKRWINMLSATVLITKESDVYCGLVIFGVCLYRVVGLVVGNVDQDHVVGKCRMNLIRGSVCNVVDCFGSKVDKPDESRERIRSLNDPLGRL